MPRGTARQEAILHAVVELVAEHGYEAVSMDAIAARARASKMTIYRHWRSKPELVVAALDAMDTERNVTIPDTGHLREDLVRTFEVLRATSNEQEQALVTALMTAMRYDAELSRRVRSHIENDELSPFATTLRRAVGRGELPDDVDETLIHDVAEALLLRREALALPFDDVFIRRVVDDVLLPLLHARDGESHERQENDDD